MKFCSLVSEELCRQTVTDRTKTICLPTKVGGDIIHVCKISEFGSLIAIFSTFSIQVIGHFLIDPYIIHYNEYFATKKTHKKQKFNMKNNKDQILVIDTIGHF
jgi:hypothetical protein